MDVDYSMSALASLSPGNKNLELSVSSQIIHSISAGIRYYGFLLKLSDSQESSTSSQYWKKSFYMGDLTLAPSNLPTLDIIYDSGIYDDRNSLVAGSTATLYHYNYLNASPTNIAYSSIQMDVLDENDVIVASANAISNAEAGIYYVNLTVPTSAYKAHYNYRER